jgi:CBS domain-containing protein
MNVADVMTPRESLVTVSLPGSRDDALEHLRSGEFSSVPVVKEADGTVRFRGLVSRESLIENPDEDQLALLLEEGPTTTAGADLAEVAALVQETGARRVPVLEGESLAGIVTVTDLVRAIAEGEADGGEVGPLARRRINTTYAGAPLVVVERELSYAEVLYAIVLDDEADVVGIITDEDLVAVATIEEGEDAAGESIAAQDDEWMWEGIKAVGNRYIPTRNVVFPEGTAGEFMTEELVTVSRSTTAREAARRLLTDDIQQVPLVTGGELVGVVRDVDLLGALA